MLNFMFMQATLWRASYAQGTAQTIDAYTQIQTGVPIDVQPASSELQDFYSARGTVMTHVLYTLWQLNYKREDIFQYFDIYGNEHQFHLVADPMNVMFRNRYFQLPVEEYPEGAKKRLSLNEYS